MNDNIIVKAVFLVVVMFAAFSAPVFAGDTSYSAVFTNYMSECASQQFSSENQQFCMLIKAGLAIVVVLGIVFILYTKLKPSSLSKVIKAGREKRDD